MRELKAILGEDKLTDFLIKCKLDFKVWCERVIQDPDDHSKGLQIKPYHMEWFRLINKNPRVAILAPTGFGKSQILGIAYTLWLVFTNRNKQVLIISKSMPQSRKLLQKIRLAIENNELLMELKPENASAQWSSNVITTSTQCRVACRPFSMNIKGEHVDYIVLDEASSYIDVNIFFDYVVPRAAAKNGKIVLISTPESPRDLMAILAKTPGFIFRSYPAIVNGKSIWPERFPMTKLNKTKQEIGETYFEKNYMCNPRSEEENAIYSLKSIEDCYDLGRSLSFATEEGSIYIGIDLAIASGPRADFDCFVVVERKGGFVILRHGEVHRGWSIQSKIDRIKELSETFKKGLTSIIVDQSNIGVAIIDELRNAGLPVKPQDFHPTNRNKLLMNLKKLLDDKKLVLPYCKDDALTQTFVDRVTLELIKFKEVTTDKSGQRLTAPKYVSAGAHDDAAMGLAMACSGAASEQPFVDFIAVA